MKNNIYFKHLIKNYLVYFILHPTLENQVTILAIAAFLRECSLIGHAHEESIADDLDYILKSEMTGLIRVNPNRLEHHTLALKRNNFGVSDERLNRLKTLNSIKDI